MAPNPSTPPRRPSARRDTSTPTKTGLLIAEALLGRPTPRRRKSNDPVNDRAAVKAELVRERTKAKRQTVDLGKPIAQQDTNTVRDRVRQWQAQGGGVIEQPALFPPEATPVVSEVDADSKDGEDEKFDGIMKTRTRKDAKIKAREEARQREEEERRVKEEARKAKEVARRIREEERQAREDERNAKIEEGKRREEERRANQEARKAKDQPKNEAETTPRRPVKRVVSDGHWRKRGDAPRGDGMSGMGKKRYGSGSPQPTDGIRVTPIRDNSSERTKPERDDKNTPSKQLPFDDGIRVTPIRSNTSRRKHRDERSRTPPEISPNDDGIRIKPDRRESTTRRTRLESDLLTPSRKPIEDDGIRVRGSSPRDELHRSTERRQRSYGSHSGDRSEREEPSIHTTPSRHNGSGTSRGSRSKRRSFSPPSAAALKAAKSAEESRKGRKSSYTKGLAPDKSEYPIRKFSPIAKVNILREVFDEGKRIFSKAAPPPETPAQHQGNRIEAWLSDTPDPFVDGVPEIPPEPVIEITHENLTRQSSIIETIVEERAPYPDLSSTNIKSSGSWTGSGRRRRHRNRSSSSKAPRDVSEEPERRTPDAAPQSSTPESPVQPPDVVESAPSLTPPSLKRTGAKRKSPTRRTHQSSPLKESFGEDNRAEDPAAPSIPDTPYIDLSDPNTVPPMPEIPARRPFPQTGRHRLSTIASVDTLNAHTQLEAAPSISDISGITARDNTESEAFPKTLSSNTIKAENSAQTSTLPSKNTSLKRRLTTHADLVSVLSLPDTAGKSIRSARSIRTNRSRLATATLDDLQKELATDENKYMRELRTLVDGVIPVLLTCVLSKSDSAIAAGLFSGHGAADDPSITRPIVDMGIALERLKSLHKRIPLHDSDRLLLWAQSAQKVYGDYLKAWRMGFQDVVVNLAPTADPDDRLHSEPGKHRTPSAEEQSLLAGLPRDENGDIVNADGERVDVAFLLKRPLVRLKYLAKTFKGINHIKPSLTAKAMTEIYESLVADARVRSNEERARLEDEAASNIDPTRSRDLKSLAPTNNVRIDRTRRVRARDYFNLEMQHSSGQRLDCRVELLFRDNAHEQGAGGDVLICEVDAVDRWLLFPPVLHSEISARNGDLEGEIIVMIRGTHSTGQTWQELLSLQTDDEQVGFEWVQMLGLVPIPPRIERSLSFVARRDRRKSAPETALTLATPTTPNGSRTPSPREIEVPFGEQAVVLAKPLQDFQPETPTRQDQKGIQEPLNTAYESTNNLQDISRPSVVNEATPPSGASPTTPLRRQRARKYSRASDGTLPSLKRLSQNIFGGSDGPSSTFDRSTSIPPDESSGIDDSNLSNQTKEIETPPKESIITTDIHPSLRLDTTTHRRTSSVPSLDLPIIPKARRQSLPPAPEPVAQEDFECTSSLATPVTPKERSQNKLRKRPGFEKKEPSSPKDDVAPPPPPHSSSPPQGKPLKLSKVPKLGSPASAQSTPKHRRSSSPLKHEYAPSSASSSSASEDSASEGGDDTQLSEVDDELEDDDVPTPLVPLNSIQRLNKLSQQGLTASPPETITPSQSASQAPYRAVPSVPIKAARAIASVSSWDDSKGLWYKLHPDECSVIVKPGLIEVFEMSAAHSKTPPPLSDGGSDPFQDQQPLIAVALTPYVPIRRSIGLDIEIRSPALPRSKVKSGKYVMLRSRTGDECFALYNFVNQSRLNNPTFLALQQARRTSQGNGSSFQRANSVQRGKGWSWGWGSSRSSYRAPSTNRPSSIAPTDSSVNTLGTAFSALKHFGRKNRFNFSRSTVGSRLESGSNSQYSSSDSSQNDSSRPTTSIEANEANSISVTNQKCRLYERGAGSNWEDKGHARLTVTLPPPGWRENTYGATGEEKRILVTGKAPGVTLLDVCLGENCFERIGRTGIALSVWVETVGPNGEVGQVRAVGGVGGTTKVYMLQMKTEAVTTWTFGLVGKNRY
ncbi:MAG: hypothetical protein M1824_001190 [Vezdaea acicularis]|nr:MAG: hypothetical protein M1824_001190 [Vezdaea acicularis]